MRKYEGVLFVYRAMHLLSPEFCVEATIEKGGVLIHFLSDGDELTVFDANRAVVFKGTIEKVMLMWDEAVRYGFEWYQKGFTPDEWFVLCDRDLRAEVVVK
jgi:hypothetical protein